MKISAIEIYRLVLPVREIYGGAAGFLEDCSAGSVSSSIFFENGILEAHRLGLGCAIASHSTTRTQGPECAPA